MNKKLILIGGVPGSGKTLIGKEIAKRIGFFVDKDSVSRFFTERMLELLGSHADDRESKVYLESVRSVEYRTMIEHALDNIEIGRSVICSAPFIREFDDPQWLDEVSLEAKSFGSEVVTIWVHVDTPTAHGRIVGRGESRDNWKLENWDAYIKTLPQAAPSKTADFIIDNSNSPQMPVHQQIEMVVNKISAPALL
ncbi:MAG: ATP-binding protein [Methyloprofundus sp.]|nr:ATP-binding protein [Methyloprofundus sp.]